MSKTDIMSIETKESSREAETMTTEEIKNYVEANFVPAQNGRKCVDGRYLPGQNEGMIARAGGDVGYVMAILALNRQQNLSLSVKDCVDIVYKAAISLDGTFYMHTDHHADPKDGEDKYGGPAIGCGHFAKAMDPEKADMYGLDVSEVQEAHRYLREMVKNGQKIEMTNLQGEHKEEAILVITGESASVRPTDGKHMFFIYDQTRDQQFMEQLVNKINQNQGRDLVDLRGFREIAGKQTNATLKILADGKQIFTINPDNNLEITSSGKVT